MHAEVVSQGSKWLSELKRTKDARIKTIDNLWNAEAAVKNSTIWNQGNIFRRSNKSSFQCELGDRRCLLGKVNIDFQDLGLKFEDHWGGDNDELLRNIQYDEFTFIFFDHDKFAKECPQLAENITEDTDKYKTQPYVSV
jgi:hypothetical protein